MFSGLAMTSPQIRSLDSTICLPQFILDLSGNWGGLTCLLIGFAQRKNKFLILLGRGWLYSLQWGTAKLDSYSPIETGRQGCKLPWWYFKDMASKSLRKTSLNHKAVKRLFSFRKIHIHLKETERVYKFSKENTPREGGRWLTSSLIFNKGN